MKSASLHRHRHFNPAMPRCFDVAPGHGNENAPVITALAILK